MTHLITFSPCCLYSRLLQQYFHISPFFSSVMLSSFFRSSQMCSYWMYLCSCLHVVSSCMQSKFVSTQPSVGGCVGEFTYIVLQIKTKSSQKQVYNFRVRAAGCHRPTSTILSSLPSMFRFQMNTKEKAKTNWQDVERNSEHSDVRQYYPEMQINLFNFEKCWFYKNS